MHRHAWAVGAVLLLALGLRALGLDWGLPQVYEEAYPFKRAWPMWGWEPGAEFDLNPHFFNYPTLYFYVQFLGQGLLFLVLRLFGTVDSLLDYRVLYAVDKTPFYVFGRSITVLFAVASVFVVYRLGVRVRSVGAGLIAAALVAVNHVHITKSQVIEVDVPLTFFLVTCVYFCVRILDDPRPRNYVLAGIFAGLATSTKYSGMLLPLCILVAHAAVVHRSLARRAPQAAANPPRKPAKNRPGRRNRVSRRGTAPVISGTRNTIDDFVHGFLRSPSLFWAGLASIAALLLTSPYVALDHQNFWNGFTYERTHLRVGHFGQEDASTILFYARVLTSSLLGWPLTITSLVALIYLVFVRRFTWAIVVSLFPVIYLTLISSFTMRAERYILPLMPLFSVLTAAFLVELLDRVRAPIAKYRGLALAVLTMLLALPSVTSFASDRSRRGDDTRTLARQWLEANVPTGAYIASEAYGPEPLSAIELAGLSLDVRQRLEERERNLPVYAMAPIPMLQVQAELMSVFYDFALYDDLADYIVTSSSITSRYRKNAQLFAKQVAFYDGLDRTWELVREFGPDEGTGPRLRIYKNPRQSVTFSERQAVAPWTTKLAASPQVAGAVGGFFHRQALNLESYQFFNAAIASYRVALAYPVPLVNYQRDITLGILRCYQNLGQIEQAIRIATAARDAARSAAEAEFWESYRAQLATLR